MPIGKNGPSAPRVPRILSALPRIGLCALIGVSAFAQDAPKGSGAAPKAASLPSPSASPKSETIPKAPLGAREWLDANRKAPDFAVRLAGFARAEKKAEAALSLLSDFFPFIKDAEGGKACAALSGEYAELLGRYSAAADWYQKAARAAGGDTDPGYSIRAAYCLMSLGEFDAAAGLVAGALSSGASYDPGENLSAALGSRAKARLARYWLDFFSSKTESLESDVLGFLAEEENKGCRPEGLFLLSALERSRSAGGSGKPAESVYAKKLLSEFPNSPEAALVNAHSGVSNRSRLMESPLWLLSGFLVKRPDAAFKRLGQEPGPSLSPAASAAPSAPAGGLPGPKIAFFQVGTFAQRKNAESLVSGLRAKSFAASMRERKGAQGQALYVVVVDAGNDYAATDLRLKEAGFESLPLFE